MIKRLFIWKSRVLLTLIFLASLIIPILIAQVSISTPIVQPTSLQLVEQGKKLYQDGKFEESATVWQQSVEYFAKQGDILNQAMSLSNLSLTYQRLGQWAQAQSAISESQSLLQNQPNTTEKKRILASTLDIEGQLLLSLGKPNNALETWQKATKLYRNIDHQYGVVQSQINQAQAMQELGFYPRACTTLISALGLENQECQISESELELLPEPPSTSLQILGLRSLGNVLRVKGQVKQAQIALLKSWKLAKTKGNSEEIAEIALDLGNTARALGNQKLSGDRKQLPIALENSGTCNLSNPYQTTTEFFGQAISCYQQAELGTSSLTRIKAQLNLLSLFIKSSQWSEVPELLEQIQSQIPSLPNTSKAISAQLKLAQNLICLQSLQIGDPNQVQTPILQSCPIVQSTAQNNPQKELQELKLPSLQETTEIVQTALELAQNLGDKKSEANALGYLGAISQSLGDVASAEQFTKQALLNLPERENSEIAYLWQWQLGRLYQAQGKIPKAIATYTSAVNILESLRQDLVVTNADIQFNFRDSVEPVYRELVDLLLKPSHDQQNQDESTTRTSPSNNMEGTVLAINQDNLNQARNTIESLQLAELNNFFREACIDAKPQRIDQLDPDAAVIYSIVLPKRLAVILSRPGEPLKYNGIEFDLSSSNSASESIERVVNEMYANLNPSISSKEPLRANQQIYDWLIRPLETDFAQSNIKTLVFVLDGDLRSLPMSALHDGKQYLVEKYNIALTPGLQLLSSSTLSRQKLKTLAAGLAEARQGFSSLPGVTKEIKDIANIFSSKVFLDQDFIRSRLKKEIEASSFPIVHLATHGQFSSQADETFLLTWDERINVKNLDQLLNSAEAQGRNPIDLLILSACQTAAGDKRAVLGLAGVAMRSGARSTLATLWSVQDQSTANFMSQFYESFKQPEVSKAEALRQAQISLLHSPQYQHPFYWAPFVLVGNWL